jgi:hypothetical protein
MDFLDRTPGTELLLDVLGRRLEPTNSKSNDVDIVIGVVVSGVAVIAYILWRRFKGDGEPDVSDPVKLQGKIVSGEIVLKRLEDKRDTKFTAPDCKWTDKDIVSLSLYIIRSEIALNALRDKLKDRYKLMDMSNVSGIDASASKLAA